MDVDKAGVWRFDVGPQYHRVRAVGLEQQAPRRAREDVQPSVGEQDDAARAAPDVEDALPADSGRSVEGVGAAMLDDREGVVGAVHEVAGGRESGDAHHAWRWSERRRHPARRAEPELASGDDGHVIADAADDLGYAAGGRRRVGDGHPVEAIEPDGHARSDPPHRAVRGLVDRRYPVGG